MIVNTNVPNSGNNHYVTYRPDIYHYFIKILLAGSVRHGATHVTDAWGTANEERDPRSYNSETLGER